MDIINNSQDLSQVDNDNSLNDSEDLSFLKTSIDNCVQYILINSQKKIPIKKANLIKDCLHKQNRNFNLAFKSINQKLEEIFGMKLELVKDKSPTQFILINKLDVVYFTYFDKSYENYLFSGILIPVLAVIFMLGGEAKEETIFSFMKTLGLDVEKKEKLSSLNYNLKTLVTSLWVKQLYLDYIKISNNGEDTNYFKWGFRSHLEISKMEILKFVSTIYDDQLNPETWREQYQEALQNDEEDAEIIEDN